MHISGIKNHFLENTKCAPCRICQIKITRNNAEIANCKELNFIDHLNFKQRVYTPTKF